MSSIYCNHCGKGMYGSSFTLLLKEKCWSCDTKYQKWFIPGLIKQLKYYFRTGKKYNYPTCCILQFCLLEIQDIFFKPSRFSFNHNDPTIKCPYHAIKYWRMRK